MLMLASAAVAVAVPAMAQDYRYDRGYIALPRQYRNRIWRPGDYLPPWFRAYAVRDPWRYGLPRPPRGCVWIWLNGDVALIDRRDGYILDIARRVW
jgi:Ni/Co efflux regulator RcnB